jgi:hypothetical protein
VVREDHKHALEPKIARITFSRNGLNALNVMHDISKIGFLRSYKNAPKSTKPLPDELENDFWR